MKNATAEDVKKAQETGKLEENVMYRAAGDWLVHGKKMSGGVAGLDLPWIIAERDNGMLVLVHPQHMRPVPKGPAQQPKRIKRKPVKGTKPEQLIPMSADVKLKVGDKVVLADGSRQVVVINDKTTEPYYIEPVGEWYSADGQNYTSNAYYLTITHKIIPWQEQKAEVSPPRSVYTGECKEVKKSPEQEAFENGCWVPFIVDTQTTCPSFAVGCDVDYLMQGHLAASPHRAEDLRWDKRNNGADIVAYRKAKQ